METTITPRYITAKTSQAGKPYYELETLEGQKYTFFSEVEKDIMNNIGKQINVDVQISGKYQNIRKFLSVVMPQAERVGTIAPTSLQPQQAMPIARPEEKAGYKFKDASMLTAYAKDLIIACIEKSEKKVWQAEDLRALREECGSQILELYNDILSAI